MMKNKNILHGLLLYVFLIILSTGCKEDPSSGSSSTTLDPNKPFTVVSHLSADPDMLNPLISSSAYATQVTNHIFSYLIHYDVETLKPSPMLAKTMPVVEEITEGPYAGGLTCAYEIHEEAVWNNGTPVTGHDVDFTLKALFNPKVAGGSLRPYLEMFKEIQIDPENPKKFTMISNRNYFLVDEIFTNMPIYPEYIYDAKGLLKDFNIKELSDSDVASKLADENPRLQEFANEFNSQKYAREVVSASGPYELKEWITGQRITLKKKKDWWGDQLAARFPLLKAVPDQIIFKPINDPTTALTEVKGGSIDVMHTIPAKDLKDLEKNERAKEMLNLHTPPFMAYYYIGLNSKRPTLSDKKVRRALAHLVDLDEAVETVMYGLAERTVGPFHPSKPYYHKGLKLVDYNPEKARALLEEAGWKDTDNNGIVDKMIGGEKVEMKLEFLVSTGSAAGKQIGILMKENAKRAGVVIELVTKEFNVLREDMNRRDFDMSALAWAQDPSLNDPKQIWHTSSDTPSGSNRVGFGNAETDALIEEIQVTLDETKRNELYKKFQEIVYDEQPYIFMFAPLERIAVSKKFSAEPSVRRPGIFENTFGVAQKEMAGN